MKHSQNSRWKFYLVSALFNGGRMGIGATTVLFMLAKGVTLTDIAMIKIIQGIVIFLGEIPTGALADLLGRKKSIIVSCIMAIVSFLIYFHGESVLSFSLAEIMNGLAICFWSGSFEAIVVDWHKRGDEETGNTEKTAKAENSLGFIFSRISFYSSIGIMCTGLVGGFLGEINLGTPFLFSAIIMVVAIIAISVLIRDRSKQVIKTKKLQSCCVGKLKTFHLSMANILKSSFREGLQNPKLQLFFVVLVLVQFAYQPVLHYWQPYFKFIDGTLSSSFMGKIFFLYVLSFIVGSFIFSELLRKEIVSTKKLIRGQSIALAVLFGTLVFTRNTYWAIFIFLLMQAIGNNFRSLVNAEFNKRLDTDNRATVLSTLSFVSRLGMITALALIFVGGHFVEVSSLFIGSSVAFLIIYIKVRHDF